MTDKTDCPYCGDMANSIPPKSDGVTVYECINGHGFNDEDL
jgi:hypothetical protein